MRSMILVAVLSCTGCYETLGSPVVTAVKYDDHGRLMVTRCDVGEVSFLGWTAAPKVDEQSCHFDRLEAPPPH